MSPVHLHLALNHVPILAIPLSLAILLYGILRGLEEVKKVALIILVACGLLVWPVYLTGEPSEEAVEDLPQVSHSLTESHEDAALFALIATELAAATALIGLLLARRKPLSFAVLAAVLALAAVASLTLVWTGYLGGQIRHVEIRADAPAPTHRDKD